MNTPIGITGGMAYSDVVVLSSLERLVAERGNEEVISYADIEQLSGASHNTVIRALQRLKSRRQITATLTPHGYIYRIGHDEHTLPGRDRNPRTA